MRIIYLNNYYYIRGGSERIFFGEIDLMKKHGHEVAGYARKHLMNVPAKYETLFPPDIVTDKIGFSLETVRTVKEIFYSLSTRDGLEKLVSAFKPDIAHVHNIYGRLTTSVLDLLTQKKVPIVMTLHDYKLACPSYRFMHKGRVCEACIQDRFYMSVLKRCHKGSYAASGVIALESYINKWLEKYRKNIQLFIAPSCFMKDKILESRWPAQQIKHIPNFLNTSEFNPQYTPGRYFLYLGRLSEEKGIDTLVRAFLVLNQNKIGLTIVGEGPMRTDLERLSNGNPAIKITGYLSGDQLRNITRNALSIVVPSVYYENAPISLLEAMAYGKPVIGAAIGGIPEMIQDGENGYLFESGNCDALKIVLERFAKLPPDKIEAMGRAARKKVENINSEESHYHNLMKIYQEVLQRFEE